MSKRQCWTCNTEHDPDEACPQSPMARAERAASGGRNSSLFNRVPEDGFSAITAKYDGQCSVCGESIHQGDDIVRSHGEYIHEECAD